MLRILDNARQLRVAILTIFLSVGAPAVAQTVETFRDCPQCPDMVVVPAGQFVMGSPSSEEERSSLEGPQHGRLFAKPFAVGKFHVTVAQFAAFQLATGYETGASCWTLEGGEIREREGRSWKNPGFPQEATHPAVCLSWLDAQAYMNWLSEKTGKKYRVLTEAEYEYSARGGSTSKYYFGDDVAEFCRYGNGGDLDTKEGLSSWAGEKSHVPCRDGYIYTSPVGTFLPNAFGLHDMHGNAWTWIDECSNSGYRHAASDAAPDATLYQLSTCASRNMRGGAWDSPKGLLRSAARLHHARPDYRGATTGLRVARSL